MGSRCLRRRSRLRALGSLACLLLGLASAVDAAPPATNNGQLRVVHAAPERGPQDIFVNGQRAIAALPFAADTQYLVVPAGAHAVVAASAGEPLSADASAIQVAVAAGSFHTLVLAPRPAAPLLLTDESLAAAAGPARVRLVHAAAGVGAVDLRHGGGRVLVTVSEFGQASEYGDAPPGTLALSAQRADLGPPLASIPEATLAPDYAYTFVLVAAASPAGWALLPLVDAYPPLRQIGRSTTRPLRTASPATHARAKSPTTPPFLFREGGRGG